MNKWYSVTYFNGLLDQESQCEYRTENFPEAIRYAQKVTSKNVMLQIELIDHDAVHSSSVLKVWHGGENKNATVENTPNLEEKGFRSSLRNYLFN